MMIIIIIPSSWLANVDTPSFLPEGVGITSWLAHASSLGGRSGHHRLLLLPQKPVKLSLCFAILDPSGPQKQANMVYMV